MRRFCGFVLVAALGCLLCGQVLAGERVREDASKARTLEVKIKSSKDGAMQSALLFVPSGAETSGKGTAVPLVVALHTWGSSYNRGPFGGTQVIAQCRRRGWAVIAPHYRGANTRPQACASDLAVADVLDAVAYARKQAMIDPKRIYLHGVSGGGHMSMVMAARAPRLWAGVSAWVGISDLAAWHRQSKGYRKSIERCCGGAPGKSPKVDAEYRKRSPLFHLAAAGGVAFDLNAGINDGHSGSVPISHSLNAYNVLAEANGHAARKLTAAQIKTMTESRKIPPELAAKVVPAEKRRRKILFQRQAGPARITIFAGGHEGDIAAAIAWLAGLKPKSAAPDLKGIQLKNKDAKEFVKDVPVMLGVMRKAIAAALKKDAAGFCAEIVDNGKRSKSCQLIEAKDLPGIDGGKDFWAKNCKRYGEAAKALGELKVEWIEARKSGIGVSKRSNREELGRGDVAILKLSLPGFTKERFTIVAFVRFKGKWYWTPFGW
jgi:poly(3-hydroxybutyrate) depolymerase